MYYWNLNTHVFIAPDVQFSTIRELEVVILDSDPYERVYNDLPAEHLVLRKVPICEYCGAIRFLGEGPGFCCRQGKVNIVNTPVPDDLQRLFTSQTDRDTLYFKKKYSVFQLSFLFHKLWSYCGSSCRYCRRWLFIIANCRYIAIIFLYFNI